MNNRRYRHSRRDTRVYELCRYRNSCNNIICIDSNRYCRLHHNQWSRHRRINFIYNNINNNINNNNNNNNDNNNNNNNLRNRISNFINNQRNNYRNIFYNMFNSSENIRGQNIPPRVIVRPELENEPIVIYGNDNNNLRRRELLDLLKEEKIKDILSKSCTICNDNIYGSKVKLDCNCEYHLKCYKIIEDDNKCFRCNEDKYKIKKCSICLEDIKHDFVSLLCNHHFHNDCIHDWIENGHGINTDKCPLCRSDIEIK